jgi:hypothetical protein
MFVSKASRKDLNISVNSIFPCVTIKAGEKEACVGWFATSRR